MAGLRLGTATPLFKGAKGGSKGGVACRFSPGLRFHCATDAECSAAQHTAGAPRGRAWPDLRGKPVGMARMAIGVAHAWRRSAVWA